MTTAQSLSYSDGEAAIAHCHPATPDFYVPARDKSTIYNDKTFSDE